MTIFSLKQVKYSIGFCRQNYSKLCKWL